MKGDLRHNLESPIGLPEAEEMVNVHTLLNLTPLPDSPLIDLVNGVEDYETTEDMREIPNTTAPDERRLQSTVSRAEIEALYVSQFSYKATDTNSSDGNETTVTADSSSGAKAEHVEGAVRLLGSLVNTCGALLSDPRFKEHSKMLLCAQRSCCNE